MKTNTFNQIVVFGLGGVGGYFGGLLAHAMNGRSAGNRQVHFIARGEHLRAIQEQGLLVKTGDGRELRCFPNTASDDPTPLPPADLILLCVKGYGLNEALDMMKEKILSTTVILPLMNGVDITERILARNDRGIVLPTCVYVSSRISAPGEITQIGPAGRIVTGNRTGTRDLYPEELLKVALEAGIPVSWEEKPEEAVWKKYLFIASFALVTAAKKMTLGEVLADPEASGLARGVAGEILRLGTLRGIAFPDDAVEGIMTLAASFPGVTKTSFQQDVESGRPHTEIDLFGGTLRRMAEASGVEIPEVEKILALLGKVPS